MVAKLRAAMAGLVTGETTALEVPATGMSRAINDSGRAAGAARSPRRRPAGERWQAGGRIGLLAWALAVVLLALALVFLFWV